jgi:hypothetical protein
MRATAGTVIPFFQKPEKTDQEQTKVVVMAEVDGHPGVFVVDLGCLHSI